MPIARNFIELIHIYLKFRKCPNVELPSYLSCNFKMFKPQIIKPVKAQIEPMNLQAKLNHLQISKLELNNLNSYVAIFAVLFNSNQTIDYMKGYT